MNVGPVIRRYQFSNFDPYTAGGQAEIELIDRSKHVD